MDEKQTQVAESLYKKLSALRATLDDNEQALLDDIVTGDFDVEGHRYYKSTPMKNTATKTTATKNVTRSVGKDGDDDEVEAHLLDEKSIATKTTATKNVSRSVGKDGDDDEVEAHLLDERTTATKTTATRNVSRSVYKDGDDDEVEAHLLDEKTTATRSVTRSVYRVTYNTQDESYKVSP